MDKKKKYGLLAVGLFVIVLCCIAVYVAIRSNSKDAGGTGGSTPSGIEDSQKESEDEGEIIIRPSEKEDDEKTSDENNKTGEKDLDTAKSENPKENQKEETKPSEEQEESEQPNEPEKEEQQEPTEEDNIVVLPFVPMN